MSPRVRAAALICWLLLAGWMSLGADPAGQGSSSSGADIFGDLHRREIEPQIRFQQSAEMGWPMRAVSGLGPGDFLWGLILICFCCLDARMAARLAVYLLIGLWLREVLALAIGSPRPWWIDARIRTFGALSGRPHSFGFPSGHAMIGAAFWFFLAAEVRRPQVWVGAFLITIAICVSRVYLGVHFISDVSAGFVVGFSYMVVYRMWERRIAGWWERASSSERSIAASGLALGMIAISMVVRLMVANRPIPQEWLSMTASARKLEVVASYAGALMALGIAAAWLKEWPRSGGPWALRIQRLALAVVVLGAAELVTLYALKQTPAEWEWTRVIFVFVMRGVQAWLAWGWLPRVFDRVGFWPRPVTPRDEPGK
jgi:membrane-associated phospholipid phosphatase